MSANNNHGQLHPEKIHLLETQIIKCNLECPFNFTPDTVTSYNTNVGFDMAFNLEDSLLKADFSLNVTTVSNNEKTEKESVNEEAKGEFEFAFIFKVENLQELVSKDNKNKIIVNGALGNAIASITYSTARGILICRLEGTGLKSFFLPVIDPNELLK